MISATITLKFLRSVKFAVLLIILLALVSLPSTLLVQGEDPAFYSDHYGGGLGGLILFLGMDDVFRSPAFLIVAGLFIFNLGYCSIWRFVRELRKKGNGRYGPDVLHLGLLLFAAGAVISAVGGVESPVIWLDIGDGFTLPHGGQFTLESFESDYYEDGRPRSWVTSGAYSTVDGESHKVSISVNSPARLEGLKIYQNSFRPKYTLSLIPRPGTDAPEQLEEGQGYAGMFFASIRTDESGNWYSLFLEPSGESHAFAQGDRMGDAFISGFDSVDITGLRLAKDPGVPVVFASFIPVGLGLFLILYEKRKQL